MGPPVLWISGGTRSTRMTGSRCRMKLIAGV